MKDSFRRAGRRFLDLADISGIEFLKISGQKGIPPLIIFYRGSAGNAAIEALNNDGADFFLKKGERTLQRQFPQSWSIMINDRPWNGGPWPGESYFSERLSCKKRISFFSKPAYALDREGKVIDEHADDRNLPVIRCKEHAGERRGKIFNPFLSAIRLHAHGHDLR